MALTKVTRNLLSTGIDDQSTSTAITIDSSGTLLVGGTNDNPAGANVVGHAFGASGYYSSTRDGNFVAFFNRKTSDGDIVKFAKDGTTVGSIGSEGGDSLYIVNGDTGLRFIAGVDSIVPANANGAARDAAIDIGFSSQRFKDIYLSGGIHLGGTTSANQLDDYEEGTWTPSLNSSNFGTSFTVTHARYVKIGSQVLVEAAINFSGTGSSTATSNGDYFILDGLPFTSGSTSHGGGSFWQSSGWTVGNRACGLTMSLDGSSQLYGTAYAGASVTRASSLQLTLVYSTH
jgi:hypothetical protein